jgi:hypothetical protein
MAVDTAETATAAISPRAKLVFIVFPCEVCQKSFCDNPEIKTYIVRLSHSANPETYAADELHACKGKLLRFRLLASAVCA